MKRFSRFCSSRCRWNLPPGSHPRSEDPGCIVVDIGVAPACPYGYYDYAPYSCAAYGYYGPEWFNGGVFIGAGPWFHGPEHFNGHVNNRYDPQHGYRGGLPKRNEKGRANPAPRNFRGNEVRDGHGHAAEGKR